MVALRWHGTENGSLIFRRNYCNGCFRSPIQRPGRENERHRRAGPHDQLRLQRRRRTGTCVTNALNHATTYAYNALGELTSTTDADGNVTTYAYDGDERLASLTDADGNTTSYAYDAAGRETSKPPPWARPTTSTTPWASWFKRPTATAASPRMNTTAWAAKSRRIGSIPRRCHLFHLLRVRRPGGRLADHLRFDGHF